jgi:hypothetical protein
MMSGRPFIRNARTQREQCRAMPTLAEVNAQDGFDAASTSPDDFEHVWRLATAR